MSNAQITIRLSPEIKAQFAAYADRFGIGDSELLRLLITRERIHKRLPKMAIKPERRKGAERKRLPTVTAHMSSLEEVSAFDEHATDRGTNRNGAGVWLITRELQEQWLKRVIEAPQCQGAFVT